MSTPVTTPAHETTLALITPEISHHSPEATHTENGLTKFTYPAEKDGSIIRVTLTDDGDLAGLELWHTEWKEWIEMEGGPLWHELTEIAPTEPY